MKKTILLLSPALMLLTLFSCGGKGKSDDKSEVSASEKKGNKEQISSSERTDKNFKTVKIGKQIWMAQNLNVSTYRNGDSILWIQDDSAWSKLRTGAFCYYQNKTANGSKYGKLYNWYAVNDPHGLAPQGWHIPSDAEWRQLIDYLGGESEAGKKLKNNSDWNEYDEKNVLGDNSSGFTALPAGFRDFFGPFYSVGSNCLWWSSSEDKVQYNDGIFRCLCYDCKNVFRNSFSKRRGVSVRCIKD